MSLYTANCPICNSRVTITIQHGHTSGQCTKCGFQVPDVYDDVKQTLRKAGFPDWGDET